VGIKKEGICGEVVRIEFGVADEVTAVLVLELDDDVGELVLCGCSDNAGADSGVRPGGNGRGCGQIPWLTTPTSPLGHPRS